MCGFGPATLFFSAVMNEDADLLRRYVEEKSEAAFAQLVRRRIGLVYAIAWRHTRDAHTAQDVTQAVFTALARKAPQLARHHALVGWLYRSAHFAATDAVRGAIRRQRQAEALIMHETDPSATEPGWQQLSPVVDDMLNGMSATDRHAVLLRVVDERSYAQIAQYLGLGESGARMRVERALEKMRHALAQRGITSTSAALTLALGSQATATVPVSLAPMIASTAVSAAAGATGVSAIVTFMSTTKVTVTALGFVALAAFVSSVYQLRTVHQKESELARLTTERDQLRGRVMQLEKKSTPQARDAIPAAATNSTSPAQPGRSDPTSAAARQRAWTTTSAINVALNSPQGKAAFIRQEVLRAEERFQPLFVELKLSPEQRTAMREQLQRYAEAKLEYYEAVRNQGFGPMNPPQDPKVLLELLRMEQGVDSTFASDLRTVLGDESARQFWDYRKTVPALNLTEQLAGQLAQTTEPLTSGQSRGLVVTLQANPYREGSSTSPGSTIGGELVSLDGARILSNLVHGDLMMPGLAWSAPITDAALEQAKTILSPGQIAALRELQARQAASYKLAPPPEKGATPEDALAASKQASPKD